LRKGAYCSADDGRFLFRCLFLSIITRKMSNILKRKLIELVIISQGQIE
jgi:hypothetical protein